ncbi:heparinase II/III family protein [Thioclava sp. F36-7]|uniref:heparinase II/III family protein n=1 Tax=Thioclava sp. F36-7 TaxID=1915317 RepID=UPI000997F0D6|nr:heparinase II/III family protein [Thioclava sp. F36-7]OOY08311.1 heparinase [Thioclava sp. F36-7]
MGKDRPRSSAKLGTALNRLAAARAGRAQTATGFVSQPEPRTIGSYAKGRQLVQGNFLFAGSLIEGPGVNIWDLPIPGPAFEDALQGCGWLDDLAALGTREARLRAQDWVFGWIDRFGDGSGPGWTPDLTGRRLIRWINHAILLLNGREREDADRFFRALGQQTIFLSKRWAGAACGLPRFEALTGLVYAGLALTGMERHADPALEALSRDCAVEIDAEGGIATRNPEELLEILTLLNWAAEALQTAGRTPPGPILDAIARIAPTLRALRHSDGALARFHGGGRGPEGRLDTALSATGIRSVRREPIAMGFVRMQGGRGSLIIDAARPPQGEASANAHASTLAFELTSGRRPLIVNCGSGAQFGSDWHRAGRATASHSTLSIYGYSSSRLGPERLFGRAPRAYLDKTPKNVWFKPDDLSETGMIFGHDGYAETHGMSHIRELDLSVDGRELRGRDTLGAMTPDDIDRFDQIFEREGLRGIPFDIRFHLHPDCDAALDLGGTAVSVALRTGEIWIFRHDGVADLALEPSVYLEKGRIRPRPAQQIVLSSKVLDRACQIGWTFSQARDNSTAIDAS